MNPTAAHPFRFSTSQLLGVRSWPRSGFARRILAFVFLAVLPAWAFAQNSSVTGCVFVDVNGNGQLDGAETNGVVGGGLNMQLRLASNNSQVGSNVTVPAGGCFSFTNLNAETYYLRTNSLKGLTHFYQNLAGRRWTTLTDVGADATDNDFAEGFHQSFVRFEAETQNFVLDGNNTVDLDLGIYISPWIGDEVFRDTSDDGIQDAGEEGVPGVLVQVFDANSSALLFETETNNDGRYQVGEYASNFSIGDLAPGSRRLEFEVPAGWKASPKDQTTDDLDSDIDATGVTDAFDLVSEQGGPRQPDAVFDAGLSRSCTVSSGTIAGRAFQDYNSDGLWQPSERTYAGTTVTAYNAANGVEATTTTLADGSYSLSVADGTAVRLEFTTLAGASLSGPAGAESGTTVQFLTAPACSADLAINRAQDYCQRDPRPVTGCFVRTAGTQSLGAIVSVPWTIGYEEPPYQQNALHEYPAAANQVGSVLGLAHHRLSNTLFAGSYLRAESSVGPAGEGAIYAMDLNNPVQATRVSTFVDLNNVPALGAGFSGPGLAGQNIPVTVPAQDNPLIGNAGLGDIDLNDAQTALYAINLEPSNSVLVEIPLLGTTSVTADTANIATYAIPNDCSVASDVRPAAIGFNDVPGDDRIFVGSVCSGESGGGAIFEANVYAYDPANMAAPPVRVLNFPLNYTRSSIVNGPFQRWTSVSSPLLADLEFDNGDMIINLRLRRGDLTFQVASPDPGDMLRACHNAGLWTLESNGSCGGRTTLGAGTGEGPGGGEYYWGDQDAVKIDEQMVGGLATSPGFPYVVTTVIDAYRLQANGFKWLSNRTGSAAFAYDIYSGGSDLLGKSTGTGDVELLCNPAPIEIGNRVWMDDGNGRQDAGEMGIAGVVVHLLDPAGTVLATATTNAAGEYYFISDDSPRAGSGASNIGEVVGGIEFATDYVVQIDPSNFGAGQPLDGKTRSPADYSANSGNTDAHDSDGVDVTIAASTFTGKTFTTGGPGSNDHRFDFGFGGLVGTYDLALTKVYTSDTTGTSNDGIVEPGGKVTFTITVINQGTIPASNIEVTDYVPTGFQFLAVDNGTWTGADGATMPTTTISGPIAANGGTAPVTITLTVLNTAAVGTSVNYAEISADDGNDVDSTPDQTNGNDAGGGAGTPSDDATGGDGTGTPGDGNAAGDQDDHDPASVTVQKYDLALIKVYTSDTTGTSNDGIVEPGGKVTFTITVINQGTIPASNVVVTDYVPTGFRFLAADNAGWTGTDGATMPTRTILGPIAGNGGTAPITITLEVLTSASGGTNVNYAEISSDDGNDVDSTPDQTNGNDAGGGAGTPSDDATGGDGTGTPGDGNAAGDQDDHDPATVTVQKYDLALTKSYTSDDYGTTNDGVVGPSGKVTYTIEVTNQGTVAANNVTVTDYVPTGMQFLSADNSDFVGADGATLPTAAIVGPIAANGGTAQVTITLTVLPSATGSTLVNYAEISGDDGNDVDSTTDQTNGNDAGGAPGTPSDDATAGDASGTPGDNNAAGDEDDHDPASVSLERYDLALRKQYTSDNSATGTSTDGIVQPGDQVTFTVTVFNQGTVTANNIQLIDFVDLTMWDAFDALDNVAGTTGGGVNLPYTWAASGSDGVVTITGAIPAGQSLTVPVTLTVSASASGRVDNFAEILTDDGFDLDSQPEGDESDRNGDPLIDDEINDDGTNDEDDHDTASASTVNYDLAVRKTVTTASPVSPSERVDFLIELINQGTEDATNIELIDTIDPAMWQGFDGSINPSGTTGGGVALPYAFAPQGSNLRIVVTGTIPAGQTVTMPISLRVALGVTGNLENYVEVLVDDGDDVDSQPEGDESDGNNDPLVDDEVDPNPNDEDDHDIAIVTSEPLSLGNRVWLDDGAPGLGNGLIDVGESGVQGVLVELLGAGGNPVDLGAGPITAVTGVGGYYLFDGLPPGMYRVRVTASNFSSGMPLANLVSSTVTEASPNGDGDSNDNGVDEYDLTTFGVTSGVVDLTRGGEPQNEVDLGGAGSGSAANDDSNLTLDFGFIPPLSLGNVVFSDIDNSGQQDPGEPGIAGVVLTLCDGTGAPILGPDSQPRQETTDGSGFYLFDGLLPGTYIVKIDPSNFQSGGPLFEGVSSSGPFEESDPNSDGDLNDNGVDDPDPANNGIQSNPVVLAYNVEPSGEGDSPGNALDSDSNVTVDFGIVLPGGGLYTIPTLGQWGLLLMVLLLMGAALPRLRRRSDLVA